LTFNVGLEEAQRRFVNRAYNEVVLGYLYKLRSSDVRYGIETTIATELG